MTLLSVLPELEHTGSLIVDDIQDDSRIRRGDVCLHVRYGMPLALNAGNLLYFLPMRLVNEHAHLDDRQKLRINGISNRIFVQAHFGQALDLEWSRAGGDDLIALATSEAHADRVLQMYAYKTGAFVAGLAEIACVIAGAGPEQARASLAFGESFGVAFQIVDDVRNFAGEADWTKITGEDLAQGKLSYVIARAIAMLAEPARTRLAVLLAARRRGEGASDVAEGIELIRRSARSPHARRSPKRCSRRPGPSSAGISRRAPRSDTWRSCAGACWS